MFVGESSALPYLLACLLDDKIERQTKAERKFRT